MSGENDPGVKSVSLPLPLAKWGAGIAAFLVAGLAYAFTNRLAWLEPHRLPLSPLDRIVPFLPWTVWIYMSAFLFLPVAYALLTPKGIARNLAAFLGLVFSSALVFILFPVTFPREAFPLADGTGPTLAVFRWLRSADRPLNCLPSLHASAVTLVLLNSVHAVRRPAQAALVLWAVLIVLATLTTKQHYVLDTVSGVLLGYGAALTTRTTGNRIR